MRRHTCVVFLVSFLSLGFMTAFSVGAQETGAIDGVIWFNGWVGWELVLREGRFILTDHANQATFRGTFERDGDTIRTTLDLRKTVFLNGPSEDGEKLGHIEELVAAGKLPPGFLGTCSRRGVSPLTVSVSTELDSISLTYSCGEIKEYVLQRMNTGG